MSSELTLEDQRLLEETLHRAASRMTRREVLAGALSALGLAAATGGLWLLRPPGAFAVGPALACFLVLVLSTRVRFDTPLGYTVPTQLAFVPLVFAIPGAIVPIAVTAAFMLAGGPELIRGEVPPSRLLMNLSNSCFSIGPVAVLAIAHVQPEHAGAALLIAALAAQFVVDFSVSSLHVAIAREGNFSSLVRASWVHGIDAALACVGLVVAEDIHSAPIAALAVVPLLGLLATFAHERHRRLQSMLELSSAYRGTALVLGDVIEADDGYTGEHCR
ncbi:MAG TPA: hypothetical protein VMJ65_20660, partial [Solirubrobacteraceae bacterium]|nr:hypothetical protein [Solirubrobacteraceae bacterium]